MIFAISNRLMWFLMIPHPSHPFLKNDFVSLKKHGFHFYHYYYNMTFGEQALIFHKDLKPSIKLPKGITWIDAYQNPETRTTFQVFLDKYYNDGQNRRYCFGINPGRFGAGVTGVPFTDPILLESTCGINNDFPKKQELSAIFIHEIIEALGGAEAFFSRFYITSLSPLGLLKDQKNYNYYDDALTLKRTTPFIINCITEQIKFGCDTERAYCLGQGKNFKIFQTLNEKYQWFGEIIPLPHPRWVMQYKRKRKNEFIDEYLQKLSL